MYLIIQKIHFGRLIVLERTWLGRGTLCSIPGLSLAIRNNWSPYLHYIKINALHCSNVRILFVITFVPEVT